MKGGYKRNNMSKTTGRRKPARKSTQMRNSARRRTSTRSSSKTPLLSITPESISIPSDISEFLNQYGVQTSSRRRSPQLVLEVEESTPFPSAEPVVIESPTEIEIETIPLRTRRTRRTRRYTQRRRPILIIESDSLENA
jgi:hypothetical protein